MHATRRRRLQCRDAIARRWAKPKSEVSATKLAFATLVEGARPEHLRHVLEWLDLDLPSKVETYNETRKVCALICELAEASMADALEQMPPNLVISFDGSWDHRRGGKQCLFSVLSCDTGKIIKSVVVSKAVPQNDPNFCEHSNLMESKGLSLVIRSLRQCGKISGYVHDLDARASKQIRLSGWDIREFLDPNHALKSFERKIKSFNRKNANLLRGIEESLRRWMAFLLKSNLSTEQRVAQWNNELAHLCGDHAQCLHDDRPTVLWDKAGDENAKNLLKNFLLRTQAIIEKVDARFSTQANESFHRVKLKFAAKDVKWGFTWKARMMAAVLDHNMPGWKHHLYQRLFRPNVRGPHEIFEEPEIVPPPIVEPQDGGIQNIQEELVQGVEELVQHIEVHGFPYRENPYIAEHPF